MARWRGYRESDQDNFQASCYSHVLAVGSVRFRHGGKWELLLCSAI